MDWVHCKSVQTTPNYGLVKLGTILGRFGDPRLSIGPLKSPDIVRTLNPIIISGKSKSWLLAVQWFGGQKSTSPKGSQT